MLCSVLPWTIPPVLMASSTTSAQVTVAAAFCLSFRPMYSKSGRPSKASLTDLLLPNASGLVNGTTSHLAPRFIVSEFFKTTSPSSTFCGHHISAGLPPGHCLSPFHYCCTGCDLLWDHCNCLLWGAWLSAHSHPTWAQNVL